MAQQESVLGRTYLPFRLDYPLKEVLDIYFWCLESQIDARIEVDDLCLDILLLLKTKEEVEKTNWYKLIIEFNNPRDAAFFKLTWM